MLRFRLLATLLLACVVACAPVQAAKRKVLMIGIDGCRTDALLAADTPHLDSLVAGGMFCDNVRILGPKDVGSDTVSGPGWTSLLTGVWADKHGVRDNRFVGANLEAYPHFFARLKAARPNSFTASIEDWGQIRKHVVSAADQNLHFEHGGKDYATADARVAAAACGILSERDPDALFVYLGNIDETGHKLGFHPSMPHYLAAIEAADKHVGEVLGAMRKRTSFVDEDWLVIVCTDHGGHGTDHSKGHELPQVNTVFLIVSGLAAKRGRSSDAAYLVDAPITALTHLGVAIDPTWQLDGQPVGLK